MSKRIEALQQELNQELSGHAEQCEVSRHKIKYISAQIYKENGNIPEAIKLFREVVETGTVKIAGKAFGELAYLDAPPSNKFEQNAFGSIQYIRSYIPYSNLRSIFWLKMSAKNLFPSAQNALAEQYETGEGIEQDLNAAFTLYQQAAEQGNVYAKYNLGRCYQHGKGTSIDHKRALECYLQAKELTKAQLILGYCYDFGILVTADRTQALEYYKQVNSKEVTNRVSCLIDGPEYLASDDSCYTQDLHKAVEEMWHLGKIPSKNPEKTLLLSKASKMTRVDSNPKPTEVQNGLNNQTLDDTENYDILNDKEVEEARRANADPSKMKQS